MRSQLADISIDFGRLTIEGTDGSTGLNLRGSQDAVFATGPDSPVRRKDA